MLTFTGHAGFKYETDNSIILMDPWMSRYGAFDQAWYQFPPNHELGDEITDLVNISEKDIYIYISHEHKDHFDIPYLQTLNQSKINYITPNFRRDHVVKKLTELKPKKVYTLEDSSKFTISDLDLYLFIDDNELNRDSGICIVDNKSALTILNLNDCKIYDRVSEIINIVGQVDIFACQFSGAVFHPVCYDYSEKKYSEISKSKVEGKFGSVKKVIEQLKPSVYIPSAGPPVFLDENLFHINFQEINIFPSPITFRDYLKQNLSGVDICVPVPGTNLIMNGEGIDIAHPVSNPEKLFDMDTLKEYQSSVNNILKDRIDSIESYNPELVFDLLFKELESKLVDFELTHEMEVVLKFSINEIHDKAIYIDFNELVISTDSEKNTSDSKNIYEISASAGDIGRLLDGYQNWDDFMLSFRHKLHRTPDVYQVAINGFLVMEKEDINAFCSNLMKLENQKERINVEVGGVDYSIDKFCPHQGTDLSTASVEDGRYLVCPKHRWMFDMEDGGKALEADATINAVDLDGDGS